MALNGLKANTKKTAFLVITSKKRENTFNITLKGELIEEIENEKYLGLWIDRNLNWKKQIETTTNDLKKRLGAISRVKKYIKPKQIITLIHGLMMSKAMYAASAYLTPQFTTEDPSHSKKTIGQYQTIINKALRLATNTRLTHHKSNVKLYEETGFRSINECIIDQIANIAAKTIDNDIEPLASILRGNQKLEDKYNPEKKYTLRPKTWGKKSFAINSRRVLSVKPIRESLKEKKKFLRKKKLRAAISTLILPY